MVAENPLIEYRYISQRQVREIVAQHSPSRGTRRWTVGLGMAPIAANVTFPGNQADVNNIYDLAGRSESALGGNMHTLDVLDENPIPDNSYLRLNMPLQECIIQPFDDVVAYAGLTDFPRVGLVFVGLIGSAANLAGAPSDTRIVPYSGRHASHQSGFVEFIRKATAEANGRGVSTHEDETPGFDRERLVGEAIDSLTGSQFRTPQEQLDGLIRVHLAVRNEDRYLIDGPLSYISPRGTHGLIDGNEILRPKHLILGSPVWLRTSEPKPLDAVAMRFEEIVLECAEVVTGLRNEAEIQPWPPAHVWKKWCDWCTAELAMSVAVPRPVSLTRERSWWARVCGQASPVTVGRTEAWLIDGEWPEKNGFAVTVDGDVYAGVSRFSPGVQRIAARLDNGQKVEPNSDAVREAADRLLIAVIAARTPMSPETWSSFAIRDGTFRRAHE